MQNPGVFGTFTPQCAKFTASDGSSCTYTPTGDGTFSQNVQRLAFYGEDSWRVSRHLTANYGLRYQTTFGLFEGEGRNQSQNSASRNTCIARSFASRLVEEMALVYML